MQLNTNLRRLMRSACLVNEEASEDNDDDNNRNVYICSDFLQNNVKSLNYAEIMVVKLTLTDNVFIMRSSN